MGRLPPAVTRDARAQSEPIALMLTFLLILAGVGFVVAVGGQAVVSAQDNADVSRAAVTLSQFDAEAAMVAQGGATTKRVRLPARDGEYAVQPDAGWVTVTVTDVATGRSEDLLDRRSMGAIVYENGAGTVAYQGGGVWRESGGSSVMVAPPEFHYRNATLTFPMVTVSGTGSVAGSAAIRANGSRAVFPNRTRSVALRNPLQGGQVEVTIHSEYYRGWASYFETRTGGSVSVDPAAQTVTLDLVVPGENPPIAGGVVASPSTDLTIKNHALADSYNSSVAPYGSFPDGDSTAIVTTSNVTVSNHAELHGDLVAEGHVEIQNHGRVYGNVSHRGLTMARHARVDGWTRSDGRVTPPSAVDRVITDRIAAYADENDNDNASVDVDEGTNRLEDCDTTCRLLPGEYYLEEIDLDRDDTLLLDTRDGRISVAVDGDIEVDGDHPADTDPEIRVIGDGRVDLYVDEDVTLQHQAGVDVVDDRAPMLWTFTRSNRTVTFQNHARYQGVVYGPGPAGTPGTTMELQNHASVFGGLVGDVSFVANHYAVHYDEALESHDPIDVDRSVPAVTYMHVTTNDVRVTNE